MTTINVNVGKPFRVQDAIILPMSVDGAEVDVRFRWYAAGNLFGMPIATTTNISLRPDAQDVTVAVLGKASTYVNEHQVALAALFDD